MPYKSPQGVFLLFLFAHFFIFGQQDHMSTLQTVQEVAWSGKYAQARTLLLPLLEKEPDNLDFLFLQAQTYSWEGNYDAARGLFNQVISIEKNSKDYWIATIKNEISDQNQYLALGLANKALIYLPQDQEILSLKDALESNSPIIQEEGNNDFNRQNTLYVTNELEVYNELLDPMSLHQIGLGLEVGKNRWQGTVTYARRFQLDGLQYGLSFYPRFGNKAYASLEAAIANEVIFSKTRLSAQFYQVLNGGHELSLGGRYLVFPKNIKTQIITGSYGLYTGNWYLRATPYYSLPQGNSSSFAFNLLGRKYLKSRNHYYAIEAGFGFDTQLSQFIQNGQLLSQTLFFLDTQYLKFAYQIPVNNEKNGFGITLGISRQEQAFALGNYFYIGHFGLRFTQVL